jgi:hypothetical protein
VIVKPAGAGCRDAASFAEGEADLAHAHIQRLHHDGRSALVQPLLPSVAVEGEWPLVFFDGRYSPAANRRVTLPRNPPVGDHVAAHDAVRAPDRRRTGCHRCHHRTIRDPTYARVDLVRDSRGDFCVLELGTAEPPLILPLAGPQALDRLIDSFRP